MARGLAVHTNKAKTDFLAASEAMQEKITQESKANTETIKSGFAPFTKHLWLLTGAVGVNLILTTIFGVAFFLK